MSCVLAVGFIALLRDTRIFLNGDPSSRVVRGEVDDIYKQCMNDVNVDGPGQFLDSRRGKDKGTREF